VTSGLVSSSGTATVETWLGAADGSLTRRGQLSIGADHRTDLPPPAFVPVLAVGNFDRDTMLDVAVTYANRDVIFLIKGNGTGDLTSRTQIATGSDLRTITSADADGDGRLDLVAVDTTIEVLLATPDGGFRAPFEVRRFSDFVDHHGSTVLFVAGDIDGDGKLDFADGSLDVDLEQDVGQIEVAPLSGGGLGGRYFLGANHDDVAGQAVFWRDIDGDGDLDMIASRSTTVTVFFNPGTGQFGPRVDYTPTPLRSLTGIAVGDLDGDHRPEIVVSEHPPGILDFIRVMKNDGAGNFSDLPSFPGTAVRLLQDFNGDGRDDLVNNGSSTSIEVRLSNGDGTFESPISVDLGAVIHALVAADVDGDGVPDLVAGTASQTVVLHGNGNGTFTSAGTAPTPPGNLLAVANIDNVPPLDIVGHNGIIYRTGNDVRTEPWSMYATDVRDTNGDGHPDVLGMGFHGFFDVPRTHAAFVLANPCH
jgi:VCBS repeat protein